MPQTKPPIKANPIEPTLRLPKQMKLSPDETAPCARLIRVRRQDYWLRYFIEHLLHGCRRRPGRDRAQAEDALKVMTSFINWQNWFDKTAKTWDVLEDFPGLDWYPWDEHDDFRGLTAITENSFNKKEQLEDELRELRTLVESPRASFRSAAAEYARHLGEALDRIAEEKRRIEDE